MKKPTAAPTATTDTPPQRDQQSGLESQAASADPLVPIEPTELPIETEVVLSQNLESGLEVVEIGGRVIKRPIAQ